MAMTPSKEALEAARKLPFAAIRDVARALDAFATRRAAEAHSEWSKYDQAVREAGWDAAIKALRERAAYHNARFSSIAADWAVHYADYLEANKPKGDAS